MRWTWIALLVVGMARAEETLPAPSWPDAITPPGDYYLFLPDAGWAVAVDPKGFTIRSAEVGPKRSRFMMEDAAGFVVTGYAMPFPDAEGAAACRSSIVGPDMSPLGEKGVRLHEDERAAYREYVERADRLEQHHSHVYMDHGTSCAEIHVSKKAFQPSDHERFDALVRGPRIVTPFAPSAVHWFAPAMLMFREQGCTGATGAAFAAITGLERDRHVLDKATWRICVENDAVCAIGAGEAARALAVLDEAIAIDPGHAPFQFGRAGALARNADAAGSLVALQRAKSLETETTRIPDPRGFAGFEPVLGDPAFAAAVAALWPGVAAGGDQRLELSGAGTVVLRLPPGWVIRREGAEPSKSEFVMTGPRGPSAARALLTLAVRTGGPGPSELRKQDARLLDAMLPHLRSADDDGDIHQRPLPDGPVEGTCVTMVDKPGSGAERKAGEGKVTTLCQAYPGDVLAVLNMTTQDEAAPEIAAMLAMLAGARREPPAAK